MMVFCAVSPAYLALMARMLRLNLSWIKADGFDKFVFDEMCCAVTAVARKKVLISATLVSAFHDFPRFCPTAFRARVVWIFDYLLGGLIHE